MKIYKVVKCWKVTQKKAINSFIKTIKKWRPTKLVVHHLAKIFVTMQPSHLYEASSGLLNYDHVPCCFGRKWKPKNCQEFLLLFYIILPIVGKYFLLFQCSYSIKVKFKQVINIKWEFSSKLQIWKATTMWNIFPDFWPTQS